MLRHAFRIARSGCWLHANVPNAKSFHRLWAVEAGLIKSEYEKSAMQIRLQQSHTFDLESLQRLVQQAGFAVEESGSLFHQTVYERADAATRRPGNPHSIPPART